MDKVGETEITWDLLVHYMRKKAHRNAHYSGNDQINDMINGPAIEPTTRATPAPPPKPAAKAALPPPTQPAAPKQPVALPQRPQANTTRTCWICSDLKAPTCTGHTADRCFANPRSAEFWPDVR